ncbi:monovalent cation/H+ antiporter subunit D [Paradevosia shaoguanensis]|uniref:Monovalent cation/H+ antiporter subunit D n=1 Tax=Paradevosia shaoguanensis TaxID=1335043 RepID=A0AA41QK29_9HYPH|nr:monovalent cation/H+ antiporter subunit D [Paradevosia shaoguanensis]MCF1741892.1 monovalent cation/H+ antiporter subunit D [Paradevosia shaoguanensis]MCI0126375.1 monovalent cation/H+ antiporter subunit D [Paradevosia shaoguanensis]QMV02735.1 monovalent cation/H+ antiporter subunit D [Devosia sp. D6-9]CDP49978.1 Na(+) H(+) antiporter subunit D [Devosia sp. DBB001]
MDIILNNLVILPILLPLATGALLFLLDDRLRVAKSTISLVSSLLLLLIAVSLLKSVDANGSVTRTYLLGNWPAPFGIVLAADRLSALMVLLGSILAICAQLFSLTRWSKAGPAFFSLVQFLIMGLSGAFLTGDVFNLFVFFEVLLAASYGLALHGSGPMRVRAGLHYIAINLAASMLFLIGVSLIYGVTGTLNMADLAVRIPTVAAENRPLLEAGMGILGVAFLIKAGVWPLCFWLPTTYAAASAPAAALFAIMSKVGIYVLLRLSLLLVGDGSGASAGFGSALLLYGGMATIAFGTIGVLASQGMSRLAGYSILVSSGTLLAAVGLGLTQVTSGALFYLASSTLTASALFLLIELVERARIAGADILAVTTEAYGEDEEDLETEEQVGIAIPGIMAILGIFFGAAALLLSGLPPLSGFIAKFAMLHGMLAAQMGAIPASTWVLVALVIISGFAALIGMTRLGISTFWTSLEGAAPHVRLVEITPVAILLSLCLLLTVWGGPVMRYMDATAAGLSQPQQYISDVLETPRIGVETGGEAVH